MGSQGRLWSASARTLQQGQAAIILLLLVGLGVVALVYGLATPAKESIEKDKRTAAALAEAKAALIGFAVGNRLDVVGTPRVGDLPCPDRVNDGTSGSSCSNGGGTTLGRLPWKSLGLPDLRDGDGERLWYAVTDAFKNNPAVGTLNSDSRGGITVRNRNGITIHDGRNLDSYTPSGIVAVIFAPGAALQRQGAAAAQDRSCAGEVGAGLANCLATQVCSSAATARCNPVNYLDTVGPPVITVADATASTEDNANFADGGLVNGFIHGNVFDANGNLVVNDRLLTITYQDLMPLMERRVAKEAFNCLTSYATASNGRYPWAADIVQSVAVGDYSSKQGVRFGRMPDSFSQTLVGTESLLDVILVAAVNLVCTVLPSVPGCMSNSWPSSSASPACHITNGSWWLEWRELVFYGVADTYKPAATVQILPFPAVVVPPPGTCPNCLVVNPPNATENKRFVVVVAGKILQAPMNDAGGTGPAQLPRTTVARKSDPLNYMEHENGNNTATSYIYSQRPTATNFNDVLLYAQ
jgi:hypothetical protein